MKQWLRYLWENEDGFFGIGMGPDKNEKSQFYDLGNLANFATSHGEADIASADKFWKGIMSGDPNKIASLLGPETSAINKQGQQELKTTEEFGNRSGGTNAKAQQSGDRTRQIYDSMVSNLVGQGASALGASGSSLLAAGASAHEGAFQEADVLHQQRSAKLNDIFKSIAEIAGGIFGGPAGAAAGSKLGGGGAGNGDFGGET
jgi:hypothetical protein